MGLIPTSTSSPSSLLAPSSSATSSLARKGIGLKRGVAIHEPVLDESGRGPEGPHAEEEEDARGAEGAVHSDETSNTRWIARRYLPTDAWCL